MEEYNFRQLLKTDKQTRFSPLYSIFMSTGWLARASVLLLSQWSCFRKFVWNAKKLMCSVRFSWQPNILDKREKKQNFMTKPSQYPEKYTRPMRHIDHSTIVWLDSVGNMVSHVHILLAIPHAQMLHNFTLCLLVGWLVVLGLTALWDSISVCIGPSSKEREKEERKDRWE